MKLTKIRINIITSTMPNGHVEIGVSNASLLLTSDILSPYVNKVRRDIENWHTSSTARSLYFVTYNSLRHFKSCIEKSIHYENAK